MLIATAGHIDHGKTSLVRALTGVETDKLPEERARGISIDLGFAYWRVPEGTIGFVDVPGHERFIRNMLAGVSAVDFALLVVAADDGVMPQTREHAQILDLMGIARGAVAITKCDRSPPERIAAVRDDVRQLLAPSALAAAKTFDVSVVDGRGIAELAAAVRGAAAVPGTDGRDGRDFRLAIDRAFTVTGVGTVVTGTVIDGSIEPGARVTVSPRGDQVRVRGVQRAGERASRVGAGERCALNLAGIEVAQLHRGDWLVAGDMHAPTARLQVSLRHLGDRDQPLRHYTPVHLHIGTADITARVLLPQRTSLAPGDEAVVQLALDHRTAAVVGDRFVLRDQTGRELIGGGHVVDPFMPADRRKQAHHAAVSAALQLREPDAALRALLATEGQEVDTLRFRQSFNLTDLALRDLLQRRDVVQFGRTRTLALSATRVAAIEADVLAILKTFHHDHSEAGGLPAREVRARLPAPVSAEALQSLLRDFAERRLLDLSGSLVKLAGHTAALSAADTALWQKLRPWLEDRGATPFTAREIIAETRTTEGAVRALLYSRRARGDIWRITETRYMLRDQVASLAAAAETLSRETEPFGFSAAQYRDAAGIGRTLAIQVLEFLDSVGVTVRKGDVRRAHGNGAQVFAHDAGPSRPQTAQAGS